MKRLLIASDRYYPGRNGLVRFLEKIVPSLQDSFDITVIAPRLGRKVKSFPGTRTILLPTYRFMAADYSPAKLKLGKVRDAVKRADIVWVQSFGTIGVMALHYAKKLHKKVCAYAHCKEWEIAEQALSSSPWLKKFLAFVVTRNVIRFYRNCDMLMLPSDELKREMEDLSIEIPKRIIPLGVDQKIFQPKKKRNKTLTLGYSGRISNEKDLITLYRAYNSLKSRHNLNFTIIGDGPERQKKIFAENGVRITGFVPDVENHLSEIDIFVSPSLTETTGLSVLEAMSCGLPVISTRVGAMRRIIKSGHNGMFFRQKDVKELSSKINTLILDQKLRKRIGRNARRTVTPLSWDNTAQQIKETLLGL